MEIDGLQILIGMMGFLIGFVVVASLIIIRNTLRRY